MALSRNARRAIAKAKADAKRERIALAAAHAYRQELKEAQRLAALSRAEKTYGLRSQLGPILDLTVSLGNGKPSGSQRDAMQFKKGSMDTKKHGAKPKLYSVGGKGLKVVLSDTQKGITKRWSTK